MPSRFRTDIAYFMTPDAQIDGRTLPAGEYWISLADARRWLDDGVMGVISPLDSQHETEFEISEEQEAWLEWLLKYQIQHVRLVEDR
ncbi:MAG: hypothetical protein QM811_19990 [Pirellulales bacterium]